MTVLQQIALHTRIAEGAEADRGVVVTADRLNPCAVSTEAARLVVPAMD